MGVGDCCGTATRCILVMVNIPVFLAGFIMLVVGGIFMVNDKMDLFPQLEDYRYDL